MIVVPALPWPEWWFEAPPAALDCPLPEAPHEVFAEFCWSGKQSPGLPKTSLDGKLRKTEESGRAPVKSLKETLREVKLSSCPRTSKLPVRLLCDKSRSWRLTRLLSSCGSGPVKLFQLRSSPEIKLASFPISWMMEPFKWFRLMFRSSSCWQLPRDVGMGPMNPLSLIESWRISPKFPNSCGNGPSKLLSETSSVWRRARFPIETGRVPVRWLALRVRSCSALAFPISLGMLPDKSLKAMSRKTRFLSIPTWGGMLPATQHNNILATSAVVNRDNKEQQKEHKEPAFRINNWSFGSWKIGEKL